MSKHRKRHSKHKPSKAARRKKLQKFLDYKARRMQSYKEVRRPEGGALKPLKGSHNKVVPYLWGKPDIDEDYHEGILNEYSRVSNGSCFNKYVAVLVGANCTQDPEQRGVTCIKEIPKGTCICHYVGKLCEGAVPKGCEYAYGLSDKEYIDATHVVYDYGYIAAAMSSCTDDSVDYSNHDLAWNYGRFINTVVGKDSSSDPAFNCYFQVCPFGLPIVRVYASRYIYEGEELLIYYGSKFQVPLGGKFPAPSYIAIDQDEYDSGGTTESEEEYIPPNSRNTNSRGE